MNYNNHQHHKLRHRSSPLATHQLFCPQNRSQRVGKSGRSRNRVRKMVVSKEEHGKVGKSE